MSLNNSVIGGFFEIEKTTHNLGNEYYKNLYSFNTARSVLEIIIKERNIKKLYIPSFFCDVILEALKKTNCLISFYDVNNRLEIEENNLPNKNSYILYINYFGIKQQYIKELSNKYRNCIIDNSQAFFDLPLKDVDTFYSPRKFFGVPDGSYFSTNLTIDLSLFKNANSENRVSHLYKRNELGPEKAYNDFIENEIKLNNIPIQLISPFTKNILKSIKYEEVKQKRRSNFELLHKVLKPVNKLNINYLENTVPLCYPLYIKNGNIVRNELIKNRIYIPKFWPNLEKYKASNKLVGNIVALPIDQRYNEDDMKIILSKLEPLLF